MIEESDLIDYSGEGFKVCEAFRIKVPVCLTETKERSDGNFKILQQFIFYYQLPRSAIDSLQLLGRPEACISAGGMPKRLQGRQLAR